MKVAKMKMLCWMCGYTRSDKIRNEGIGTRWSCPGGGEDAGSKTEMVGASKQRCTNAPCGDVIG